MKYRNDVYTLRLNRTTLTSNISKTFLYYLCHLIHLFVQFYSVYYKNLVGKRIEAKVAENGFFALFSDFELNYL